jgi:hypothetical protein
MDKTLALDTSDVTEKKGLEHDVTMNSDNDGHASQDFDIPVPVTAGPQRVYMSSKIEGALSYLH